VATVIVDASVASAWCFPDEETGYTSSVLKAVATSFEAIAPRLWAYEVRNSVLMGSRRGRITKEHAERFSGVTRRATNAPHRPGLLR
jgi:predicted nucleic acid-binding protein